MRRITALLLILCFLLCACEKQPDTESLNVYYCAQDGGMAAGSAIVKKTCEVPAGADRLLEALRLLTAQPEDDALCSAFPAGIRIETYSLEKGEISVMLTEGYQSLPPFARTTLRACIVLTLCGLEEVERVSLYEDAHLLESGLTGDGFLSESLPEGERRTELRFWFPDPENVCLVSEVQTVKLRASASMAETVLRQLMPSLYAFGLPAETQVLSVSRREGVCVVDLSAEFWACAALEPTGLRLLLYSIVNTLTELDTVEAVLFRCEGSGIGVFGSMELNGAFRREEGFTADMMSREDCETVTLYLMTSDGRLAPIRLAVVKEGDDETPVVAALRTLLHLNSYWGFQPSFAHGTELIDCFEKDGVAVLVLGENFWSVTESFRELTASALVATASDTGQVEGIRIMTASRDYRNREILRKNGDLIAEG